MKYEVLDWDYSDSADDGDMTTLFGADSEAEIAAWIEAHPSVGLQVVKWKPTGDGTSISEYKHRPDVWLQQYRDGAL